MSEFDGPSKIRVGEEVEVLLEAVEDDSGLIKLSNVRQTVYADGKESLQNIKRVIS